MFLYMSLTQRKEVWNLDDAYHDRGWTQVVTKFVEKPEYLMIRRPFSSYFGIFQIDEGDRFVERRS